MSLSATKAVVRSSGPRKRAEVSATPRSERRAAAGNSAAPCMGVHGAMRWAVCMGAVHGMKWLQKVAGLRPYSMCAQQDRGRREGIKEAQRPTHLLQGLQLLLKGQELLQGLRPALCECIGRAWQRNSAQPGYVGFQRQCLMLDGFLLNQEAGSLGKDLVATRLHTQQQASTTT